MTDKAERYGSGAFFESLCDCLGLHGRPELIRHNTNLIYDGGEFVVRLTPNSFRPREEVERELHWMKYVATRTPDVVQLYGDDRELTRQFEFDGEEFTVTMLEKIIGEPIGAESWNGAHFERLGRLTGFMHRIGQDYQAPAGFELTEWDATPDASLADHLPDDDRDLSGLSDLVLEHMAAMPRGLGSYGPIHYDIHSGNYLITPAGRMVLFDFENSCCGHYINDIAVVLYYARLHKLSELDDDFDARFLAAFWKGYAGEYPVPEDQVEHIPWLLLNRGLIVYGYVLKIWPGELDDEQRFYLGRIEESISRAREALAL